VFVGRVEIISPAMVMEVDRAIRANDMTVLTQYGRFLEPIAQRIFATSSVAVQQPQVNAALQSVARRYVSPQAACGVSAPVVATTAER
jgi:hypothetical protein